MTRSIAWWARRRKRVLLALYLAAALLLLAQAFADPLIFRLGAVQERPLQVSDFTPLEVEAADGNTIITVGYDSQLLLEAENIRSLWVRCTFSQDPGEFVAFYQADPAAPFSADQCEYARLYGDWYVFRVPYGTRKLRLDPATVPSVTVRFEEIVLNRIPDVTLPTDTLVWAVLLPGLLFILFDWQLELWAEAGPALRRGKNKKGKRPAMTVTKDTIIADILQNDPQRETVAIFLSAGMHCLGCLAAHGETVEQACEVHGVDADDLVRQLNDYFATLG